MEPDPSRRIKHTAPAAAADGPWYVSGPIRVSGFDPYGLDYDNDGIGCE
jgi:hypothetical protein